MLIHKIEHRMCKGVQYFFFKTLVVRIVDVL